MIIRYNTDCSLDTTFDDDGIFTSPIGTGINRIYSSQTQADGKILLGGESIDIDGDGNWYILRSSDNQTQIVKFGLSGDIPTSGDFDGDRNAEITIFRPSSGVWYRMNLVTSQVAVTQFGLSGDKPIPSYYLP